MPVKYIILVIFCLSLSSCLNLKEDKRVNKDSLLVLNIKGVITSDVSEKFMRFVRTYAGKNKIKGILIRVNSPGGTVGASQEIYSTIKDIKNIYKKPVFVSGGDMVASGGVYATMAADTIFINKGTLFGSIGVLMQFQNYSELMKWAKTDVYHLKAGEFKDSGSPYRKMTLRERELFERLMENTLNQFKEAIATGRNLNLKSVNRFSDGRIFSGEEALGFELVDKIGTFNQAASALGEQVGLGTNPKLFDPDKKTGYEKLFADLYGKSPSLNKIFSQFSLINKLSGQALYILPSYISAQ